MTAHLAFIDTETTSLRHDRRAWEIGLILRASDGHESEHRWFIRRADLDLGNADVQSLKVGRFYERHPRTWDDKCPIAGGSPDFAYTEASVLDRVEHLTRGAHLVGAVVSFDADVLGQRMRANGICPSWHYHLIDVEALAVGYLSGKWTRGHEALRPPWKSDTLSAELGITVSEEDRHTALGDARWAMRIYDHIMGGAS